MQSLTNHSIRIRMGGILKAITRDSEFVPTTVVSGFREWVEASGLTSDERRMVDHAAKETLVEIERRLRWVKQELENAVFKK